MTKIKKLLLLSLLVLFGCSKDTEEEVSADFNVNFLEKVDGKIFVPLSNKWDEHIVLVKFAETWSTNGMKGVGGFAGLLKKAIVYVPEESYCEVTNFNEHSNNYEMEEINNGIKFTYRGGEKIEAFITSISFPLKVTVIQDGNNYLYEEITENEARSIADGLDCNNLDSFVSFFDF